MDKVQGKKLTFKYTCDVHNYIRSRSAQAQGGMTPHPVNEYRSGSSTPILLSSMGEGQDGEDIEDEVSVVGEEKSRLYGSVEMQQQFQHAISKTSEMMREVVGVVSQCDLPGVVKECDLSGVVEQETHSSSSSSSAGSRMSRSLCGEAVWEKYPQHIWYIISAQILIMLVDSIRKKCCKQPFMYCVSFCLSIFSTNQSLKARGKILISDVCEVDQLCLSPRSVSGSRRGQLVWVVWPRLQAGHQIFLAVWA